MTSVTRRKTPSIGATQGVGLMAKSIVESLRASNLPLELAGEDQKSFADRETMISATPDGVALLDDERYQFEFKTIDPGPTGTSCQGLTM